jgi:hypothetical protein
MRPRIRRENIFCSGSRVGCNRLTVEAAVVAACA